MLLIGMMGAGKSAVGCRLAARLHRDYVDSDEQVVASTGRTVAEIFASEGEATFRREEAAALRAAVARDAPSVIAVAGGAVLDPANRELIGRSGTVVWLRAAVSTLATRAQQNGGHRPLLAGGDAEAVLERLDAARRPLYAELADVTVDVDHLSIDQVVDAIAAQVPA